MGKHLITATLGATAAAVAGISAAGAWRVSGRFRPWPPYRFSPYEVGIEAEDVTFTSADGVRLAGWWMDCPGSADVIVLAHGHRGDMASLLGLGPMLRRAGHSVLLFDFRGCGDSADGPQSLGLFEQRDLEAAIELVRKRRPDARLGLLGMSMGAAASICVAARDPRVEALVLDSPFATAAGVVGNGLRPYRLPTRLFTSTVDLVTRAAFGYRFADMRPVDAIGRIDRPILLMHGTEDRVTRFEHSRMLRDAARPGRVEYVAFEGADHCGGYFTDRPGYVARIDDFIRRSLPYTV